MNFKACETGLPEPVLCWGGSRRWPVAAPLGRAPCPHYLAIRKGSACQFSGAGSGRTPCSVLRRHGLIPSSREAAPSSADEGSSEAWGEGPGGPRQPVVGSGFDPAVSRQSLCFSWPERPQSHFLPGQGGSWCCGLAQGCHRIPLFNRCRRSPFLVPGMGPQCCSDGGGTGRPHGPALTGLPFQWAGRAIAHRSTVTLFVCVGGVTSAKGKNKAMWWWGGALVRAGRGQRFSVKYGGQGLPQRRWHTRQGSEGRHVPRTGQNVPERATGWRTPSCRQCLGCPGTARRPGR